MISSRKIVLVLKEKSNYNRGMKKHALTSFLFLIALIFLDQITKYSVDMPIKNAGIAFGIPIQLIGIILMNILLLILLLYFAKKELNLNSKLAQYLLALVFAGGISNLIDRLYHGYVIDFISIWIWPTFNFADIYITIGILLLIIFYGKIKRV